jgi:sugar phosphate isomerase/epimerase
MQIAFNSVAFHQSPLELIVPELHELGYDAIELNAETLPWAAPHVTPSLSQQERAQLKRLLQRHDLQVSSISAHMSLVPPNRAEGRQAVDFVKGCIDLACDLEVAVVHGLTGPSPEGVSRDVVWGWLLAALRECLEHATARGVTFALEPVVNMLVCDSWSFGSCQQE